MFLLYINHIESQIDLNKKNGAYKCARVFEATIEVIVIFIVFMICVNYELEIHA